MKTQNISHWNRPLAFVAWAAFAVSFFLPSYADGQGYQCAIMQRYFWSGAMQGEWAAIHYELLTLPNLLMVVSPLLMLRFADYPRGISLVRCSTLVASIFVWSFLILLFAERLSHDLKVGAYVWASSFVVLWVSSILPHKTLAQASNKSDAHEPPPRASVSILRVIRTLDSQPARVSSGGR